MSLKIDKVGETKTEKLDSLNVSLGEPLAIISRHVYASKYVQTKTEELLLSVVE